MFDQHTNKAFQGTKRSAVDHDRAVGCVVLSDILETEALGQVVVYLNSTKLPLTPDRILDNEINFGPIEGGLPGFFCKVFTQ